MFRIYIFVAMPIKFGHTKTCTCDFLLHFCTFFFIHNIGSYCNCLNITWTACSTNVLQPLFRTQEHVFFVTHPWTYSLSNGCKFSLIINTYAMCVCVLVKLHFMRWKLRINWNCRYFAVMRLESSGESSIKHFGILSHSIYRRE